MKHVYSPSGSAEAHMLAHMLEQAGIKADIHGEALLGAVGELPVNSLIKIAVADEDYERARKLILEWEKKSPPDALPKTSPGASRVIYLAALLIGAVLGWLANGYSEEAGLTANPPQEIDQNKDGKTDFIYHYKNKDAVFAKSSENDINFDGTFDIITQYDTQGAPIADKADYDFNGTFETTTVYKNGAPTRSEMDTDGDGKADMVTLLEHGIPTQTQIMNPKTGKLARIDFYSDLGILQSADFDADGDGILETHYTYDRYGQIISTEKKAN